MRRKKVKHPRLHLWDTTTRYHAECLIRGCKAKRCEFVSKPTKILVWTIGWVVTKKGKQCKSARLPDGIYCGRHRKHMNAISPKPGKVPAYKSIRYIHQGRNDD